MENKKFEDLVYEVYRFFESSGYPYLVIGGLASSVLGEPRLTVDFDVLLFVRIEEFRVFLDKAHNFGFEFDYSEAEKNVQSKLCFQMKFGKLIVDCLIGTTAFEVEALSRRIKVKLRDIQISFPSPEDFILMKLLVNREKDWLDAKNVALRHYNKLDVKYLNRWAKTFADMRKDNTIIEHLTQLLSETKTSVVSNEL